MRGRQFLTQPEPSGPNDPLSQVFESVRLRNGNNAGAGAGEILRPTAARRRKIS